MCNDPQTPGGWIQVLEMMYGAGHWYTVNASWKPSNHARLLEAIFAHHSLIVTFCELLD